MKNLKKNILQTILLLFISLNINAQFTANQLLGTWEHADGNQIFRIEFFRYGSGNQIRGDFKLVSQDILGQETVIYQSHQKIGTSDSYYPPVISLGYSNNYDSFKGSVRDNTSTTRHLVEGCFTLKLLQENPLKAKWNVTFCPGLKSPNEVFNIPTDLIMTKVD